MTGSPAAFGTRSNWQPPTTRMESRMRPAATAMSLPRWPSAAFPGDLQPATARLRTHLQGRIHPDGAVRDPCRSRVMESALLLTLLNRTRLDRSAHDRLASFLAAHRDTPEPLDRLMARTALYGSRPETDPLDVDRFLMKAPHFTGPRKRVLLHVILLLLQGTRTAPPPPPPCDPEAFSLDGLHSWARIQVTAVKVILARVQHHLVDEHDVATPALHPTAGGRVGGEPPHSPLRPARPCPAARPPAAVNRRRAHRTAASARGRRDTVHL